MVLLLLITLNLLVGVLAQPQITVRKSILRIQKVTPGYGSSTEVSVTLFFDSEGVYSFADNLVFAECGSIVSTTPASGHLCGEGRLRVSWLNLSVSTGEPLKYTAQGLSLLEVDLIVSAGGSPLELSCEAGYCKAVALGAREVNYTIVLRPSNVIPEGVQLPVSVSWSVDPVALYPVAFSENPQSLRESGTEISFQWTVFLNGTYVLSVVFEVRGENPWGEVLVPAPAITVSLDPRLQLSLMERYRSVMASFMERSVGNLTELRSNITKLRDLLFNLSAQFEQQSSMLASAAGAADEASDAISVAVAQLTTVAQTIEAAESALRRSLENASSAVRTARDFAQKALENAEELELELSKLNTTWLGNYTFSELVDEAKRALSEMQSQLSSFEKLLDQYEVAKGRLYTGVNELRVAAAQLRRLSSLLREGSYGMAQLAKGLREAAELIDSSLLKLAVTLEAQPYPEGLLEFNRTITSQVVEPIGGASIRSELMSDVVYVSLPLLKLKRSEPETLTLTTRAASPRSGLALELAALLILAAATYAVYIKNSKRSREVKQVMSEISRLRERLSRFEVG